MSELPPGKDIEISYSKKLTIGLPNYSSKTVDFGVSARYATKKEADKALDALVGFVNDKVKALVAE